MSDVEIVKEFLVESYENLDRLDRDLLELEKDPSAREVLASIFRTIHTIKGTCGFLGFNHLETVAHSGENLLARLRDGQLELNADITNALLKTVDSVREMLANIGSQGNEGERNDEELIATLTRLLDAGRSTTAQMPAPERVQAEMPANAATKAGGEPKDNATSSSADTPPPAAMGQAAADRSAESSDAPERPTEVSPVALRGEVSADTAPTPATKTQSVGDSTIRVDVSLLDQLMNLVGELVLARNQILQFTTSSEETGLLATSQRLNLITTELQEGVMKTRMQPIGNVWSKFPRLVRDLAVGCGKQVRIEMEGKETELDKTIIEAIKDPLTHLVRNAVDHGIEPPAARTRVGKNAEGNIFLRAFHEGGQVNIEISDDGAGLDLEKIRAKAIQKGLITSDLAMRMGDRDLSNLVFLAGLSTAEKVTNISGRGVGMDVVKTNIEKIGGTVDVHSNPGRGATVRVKIPLTLAIIPALMVASAGDRYAIPQVSLLELVRIEGEHARKRIELIHGAPVYRLRGRLLPLVYLNRELKTGSSSPDASSSEGGDKLLDFAQARMKHEQWIARLRQVLDGRISLTVEEAGSPRDCALGKWLYSSGMKRYGEMTEMQTLEASHRQFHELVRKVVGQKAKGENSDREFSQVEPLSKKIIQLLKIMEKKISEAQNVNIVVLQAEERQFGLVVDGISDTEEIVVKPLSKQLKGVNVFAGATILGDGKVALILDVLGLAQRANVVTEVRDHALGETTVEATERSAEKRRFLLFAGPGGSRMAIPLDTLARLEELPASQVERAGTDWVAQYRGQILPLVNLEFVLEERRQHRQEAKFRANSSDARLQVLVCNHEGRSVGLVVEQILDIVEDAAEVKYPASRAGVLHSTVINERVTELIDIPAVLRTAGLRFEGATGPALKKAAEAAH